MLGTLLLQAGNPVRRLPAALSIVILLILLPSQTGQALERMDERMAACAACHGEQGRSERESYYPSIAGKPAAYLFNQLRHFRDGRRQHAVMADMLAPLSDDYLHHMAAYYAAQTPRVDTRPAAPDPQRAEQAQRLVREGDPGNGIPACADCHGARLHGRLPAIPGLTGLSADYIAAQMGAWREGVRTTGTVDCMAEIAQRLSVDQVRSVAQWLAAQPASPQDRPAAPSEAKLPLTCFDGPVDVAQERTLQPAVKDAQQARGAYLLRAGNCAGCHTRRGGEALAGGRAITTPFGAVYSSNLTPDADTGIGNWSADDFWNALHRGIGRGGRLLYPAFPYTHYTRVTRADSDAMLAALKAGPPVSQPATPHALRFPFNTQFALRIWRWLYFDAGVFTPDPQQDAAWNRGRYLVEGLGHCSACHGERDALGGIVPTRAFAGSLLPDARWYAPPLRPTRDAADRADLLALLKHGISPQRGGAGPMAAVVQDSLQHLTQEDLSAMIRYIDSLPSVRPAPVDTLVVSPQLRVQQMEEGADIYKAHCADCHGAEGAGEARVYPPLAGNDSVTAVTPMNAIRWLQFGGFAPSTAGNPYPFGMPPFAHQLAPAEQAAVLTYIRNAWGNQASAVSPVEVAR